MASRELLRQQCGHVPIPLSTPTVPPDLRLIQHRANKVFIQTARPSAAISLPQNPVPPQELSSAASTH